VAGWFDATVLANSFAQVWDIERARYYWDLADKKIRHKDARIHSSAKVLTLRAVGMFYYTSNTAEDLKHARKAFKNALDIVDTDAYGPELTRGMNSDTLFLQAQQEDRQGNTAEAATRLREAWDLAAPMQTAWRRQQAKLQFASFVVFGTYYESDPGRFGPCGGVPQEIADEAAKLKGLQQQQPAVQQLMTTAWQQGFIAGQRMAASQIPAEPWTPQGMPAPQGVPGSPSPQAVPGQPVPGPAAGNAGAAAQPPYLY
jgi:tetratricopeptide (TPR) repeat protein